MPAGGHLFTLQFLRQEFSFMQEYSTDDENKPFSRHPLDKMQE